MDIHAEYVLKHKMQCFMLDDRYPAGCGGKLLQEKILIHKQVDIASPQAHCSRRNLFRYIADNTA
jgi:hypothetical protein